MGPAQGPRPAPPAAPAPRALRSANLSHITGTSRKIQMFIKNRHLQLLPDGTVNGTFDNSNYTILQRTTVNIGQLKIQGVATCLYLCMDACGFPYSSRKYTNECIFNEMFEKNQYNTYSSANYSDSKYTMYLALNANGKPRRVVLPKNRTIGKLSKYVVVLPKEAPNSTETGTCSRTTAYTPAPPHHPTRHGCRNGKKRKRKCKEGEKPGDTCELHPNQKNPKKSQHLTKCPEGQMCKGHFDKIESANTTKVHGRHKKLQKLKKNPRLQNANGPGKKRQQKQRLMKIKRGGNKRAIEERSHSLQTTTGSSEIDEMGMSTSDEWLSSTQMDDFPQWELTTNSGFNGEFFRPASVVQETAEEDDI